MKKPRISFQTLGCKLNFSESSDIARKFSKGGFNVVDYKDEVDYFVLNSCTVTGQADKKCRAAIRQAHKRNPNASLVVTGCFSQTKAEELMQMDGVEIVIGNVEKSDILQYINEHRNSNSEFLQVENIKATKSFYPSYSLGDRTRSFVKVQDGCDYFCSYCIIPSVRGRSRSDTISSTINTVSEVAKTSVREIILTGVNIGDFGKNNDETFLELIRELDKVNGIERFRISSIEPDLLNDNIINFIASSKKFLPHFHLPLQSGSDKILKAMKRKYNRELFSDRVAGIKAAMPLACIAADVITGFPGESDQDFNDTYNFLKSIDLSYIHVFSYSERQGTISTGYEGKVPKAIVKSRSRKLHELSEEKKLNFYRENMNNEAEVLYESKLDDGYIYGFTDNYIRVKTPYKQELINNIISVKLNNLDEEDVIFETR